MAASDRYLDLVAANGGVLADFVQRNAESVTEHIWFRIDSDEERAVTLRTHDEVVALAAMLLESPHSLRIGEGHGGRPAAEGDAVAERN